MRIEYWSYTGVRPDGTFDQEPGCVLVDPGMTTGGLHRLQTRSAVEAGLWLSVSTGRLPDGFMHGITLFFDDDAEMRAFEQTRKAVGQPV